MGLGISGGQQITHLLPPDRDRVQGVPVVGGERGGVGGCDVRPRTVQVSCQLAEPLGCGAVTEANRGVQREHLVAELATVTGEHGGIPRECGRLGRRALRSRDPRPGQDQLGSQKAEGGMLLGLGLGQEPPCCGGIPGHGQRLGEGQQISVQPADRVGLPHPGADLP
ncbi:hypothetical protein OG239_01025 [Streptomyces sp. NBC_00868]|uniref:hypothetical protein n=1 Tax=Streptomyces sp. NBC_00868 TaxID=2903683 RepID=UPI00386D075B|nr:hypothetical protein OG239_01025 [Streptomyces sp. NBC_00868]